MSKEFLDHLYTITNFNDVDALSFEACEIPKIRKHHHGTDAIDDDKGNSLHNILKVWAGDEVTFRSCPSFNDTFLSWFALERKHVLLDLDFNDISASMTTSMNNAHNDSRRYATSCPAERSTTFTIDGCNNSSSHALKEFVRLRNEYAKESLLNYPKWVKILDVIVDATGPVLRDEDRRWFEQNAENTTVHWKLRDDQGITEVYYEFTTPVQDD